MTTIIHIYLKIIYLVINGHRRIKIVQWTFPLDPRLPAGEIQTHYLHYSYYTEKNYPQFNSLYIDIHYRIPRMLLVCPHYIYLWYLCFSIWYIQVQSRQYIVGRLFIWINCLTADGWVCGLGGQISKLNSICKSFKKAENIWQF